MVQETQQGLEIRFHSVSYCLCTAQQIFIYQTFAFPSPCELPSSSLRSQTTTPLLSLAVDGVYDEGFGHFGELLSFPGSLPCVHVIKFFV